MNVNTAEKLGKNLLFVLIEKNCSDLQLENAKNILILFMIEKKIPQNELKIFRVNNDAVLLKSQKIMEKQFPLIYFIAQKKFLGYNEIASTNLDTYLNPSERGAQDAIDSLRSFFRGCEMLVNPNIMEALSSFQDHRMIRASPSMEVGYTSQIIENSLWTVKWAASSAWSSLTSYYSTPTLEEPPKKEDDEEKTNGKTIDVDVVKTNWYGRTQRRIYRFHEKYFERIDPIGSLHSTDLVKATFSYSDVDHLSIENGNDLTIFFVKDDRSTQWIHTIEANRIAAIIRARTPLAKPLPHIIRNLESKMMKQAIFTLKIVVPNGKISGYPRWSRDGLRIAYHDESSEIRDPYRIIDLETLEISSKEEANLYDVVNATERFVKRSSASLVGVSTGKHAAASAETISKDFYDYAVHMVAYADAFGCKTMHAGLIAETIDSASGNCAVFVTKAKEFSGQWKLRDQKLFLFDNKGGAPVCSPDGKYVAFIEQNTSSIIVQKIGDLRAESVAMMETEETTNPDSVLFDVQAKPVPVYPREPVRERRPEIVANRPDRVELPVNPPALVVSPSEPVLAENPRYKSRIPTTIPTALHFSRESSPQMSQSPPKLTSSTSSPTEMIYLARKQMSAT